ITGLAGGGRADSPRWRGAPLAAARPVAVLAGVDHSLRAGAAGRVDDGLRVRDLVRRGPVVGDVGGDAVGAVGDVGRHETARRLTRREPGGVSNVEVHP